MFGTTVPWRVLIVPAVAVALVQLGSHHHPPLRPQPPLPILVVPQSVIEAPFDLRGALAAIGRRALAAHPDRVDPHPELIPAAGPCERPGPREQNELTGQLMAWVDATYTDEKSDLGNELALRFGCFEPNGTIVVDGVSDRMAKDSDRMTVQRSWIWQVTPGGRVAVIDERTSTASDDQMEGADEGTLGVVALIDLDRDGTRDVVTSKVEYEGGAVRSDYTVSIKRGAKLVPVVHMSGVLSVSFDQNQIVFALGEDLDHPAYRCIGSRLKLVQCRAGASARAIDEQREIANRMIYEPALDRETLVEELQTLEVPAAERAPILAAATATTPAQRAQRHVAAFLAHRPDGDLVDLGEDLVAPDGLEPFDPVETAKALATLGADRTLLREVRALAP